MEAAAKRFEQEDGIVDEILKQTKGDNNMYSYPLSHMFQRAEANGYTSYCELEFDSIIEHYSTPDQATINEGHSLQSQHVLRRYPDLKPEVCEISFSSAASTLCSLSELVESSCASKNVSPMHLFYILLCCFCVITSPALGLEIKF